jgi:hypothetical protein
MKRRRKRKKVGGKLATAGSLVSTFQIQRIIHSETPMVSGGHGWAARNDFSPATNHCRLAFSRSWLASDGCWPARNHYWPARNDSWLASSQYRPATNHSTPAING